MTSISTVNLKQKYFTYDDDFYYRGRRSCAPPTQLDLSSQTRRDLQTAKNILALPDSRFASVVLAGLARRNGYNILRDAIQHGLTNIAKIMLKYGALVNNVSGKPIESPLHMAVLRGDEEMCKLLLLRSAKTFALNEDEESPLFLALKTNNQDIVRLLLTRHAGVRVTNVSALTRLRRIALSWLSYTLDAKTIEFASLLLSFGVELEVKPQVNVSMFNPAFDQTCMQILKLLMEVDADLHMFARSGVTPLMKAIERGDIGCMLMLLNSGAMVNSKSSMDECSPLSIAVQSGREDVVRILLSDPLVRVNSKIARGVTALHLAVQRGDVAIVKALLQKGAEIDLQDDSGRSALHYAIQFEPTHGIVKSEDGYDESILDILLQNHADVNLIDNLGRSPLHYAIFKRSVSFGNLLNNGADVNLRDIDGKTPLHVTLDNSPGIEDESFPTVVRRMRKDEFKTTAREARDAVRFSCSSRQAVIEALIHHGADVNATDIRNRTALHYAAESWVHTAECTSVLCKYVAVVDPLEFERKSPLKYAPSFSQDVIRELLKQGADIDAQDSEGRTPLHIAIESDNERNFVFLEDSGARIDLKDSDGRTLVHYVAKTNMSLLLTYLLRQGLDINSGDHNGKTPFEIALRYGNELVITQMIDNGAYTDFTDERGDTPLHHLAKNNMELPMSALFDRKPDLDVRNFEGKTPLYVFVEEADGLGFKRNQFYVNEYQAGDASIATMLLRRGAVVDCRDKCGKTELHIAAEKGRADIVAALLKSKADVKARTFVFPHDTPLRCSRQPATEVLENHIVMLAAANYPVDEMDLKSIDYNNPRLQKLQLQCGEEIRRSKEVDVVNGHKTISLYDILTNNERKLLPFLRSKPDTQVKNDIYKKFYDFKVYFDLITRNYFLAEERAPLLGEISLLPREKLFFLPHLCIDGVTSYLTNKDLKSLITAVT